MPTKGKGRASRPDQQVYAHALPLVHLPSTTLFARSLSLLRLHVVSIENPHCVGIFDEPSRSVWIVNARDRDILWRRGFFGKGNLSRSEPSLLNRRLNQLGGTKVLTAEEITALRRAEREHFKSERERAVNEAAAQAEELFRTEGKLPDTPAEHISTTVRAKLAAQKRNATVATKPPAEQPPEHPVPLEPFVQGSSIEGPSNVNASNTESNSLVGSLSDTGVDVEDMEHLQLSLQEAFFLAWALGCLEILHPSTGVYLSREDIWRAFLISSSTLPSSQFKSLPGADAERLWKRPDNPFLVNYVAYHHFRSLGWVVKNGMKFCVDLLLYKRGPVFSHAEFSIVVCPVYEDPMDRESSPFDLPNVDPFTWSWLSTLNRVNTQVRKSLMIAYVTIPSLGRLQAFAMDSPKVFMGYTVREVTIKRFIPARMRD